MHDKVTGIIIAGGTSTRMGEYKALLKYEHERLIDRAIRILDSVVDFLIISRNEPLPKIPYVMVKDEIKNVGPLGGLYSALKKSHTNKNVVLACDMPNVESDFLERLVKKLNGHDIVVPKHSDNKLEPLAAVYSKRILPTIENQIEKQDYKLLHLLDKVQVLRVKTKHSSMFKKC